MPAVLPRNAAKVQRRSRLKAGTTRDTNYNKSNVSLRGKRLKTLSFLNNIPDFVAHFLRHFG